MNAYTQVDSSGYRNNSSMSDMDLEVITVAYQSSSSNVSGSSDLDWVATIVPFASILSS